MTVAHLLDRFVKDFRDKLLHHSEVRRRIELQKLENADVPHTQFPKISVKRRALVFVLVALHAFEYGILSR